MLASAFLYGNRQIIMERAATLRLPAMYEWPNMAEEGGFVAYGARLTQLFRDIFARQCVKLLRGVQPADIPVEQATKFELVVNLKTAKALGLTVQKSLLVQARRGDRVSVQPFLMQLKFDNHSEARRLSTEPRRGAADGGELRQAAGTAKAEDQVTMTEGRANG